MPEPIFSSATVSLHIYLFVNILCFALAHDGSHPFSHPEVLLHFLGTPASCGSFTASFLAQYSVHIRFHWTLKPHEKEVLLPFCSSTELHSTTTERVPFFEDSLMSHKATSRKSSHYTENLLYPQATNLHFGTDYAHHFYFTANEFLSRRLLSYSNK